MGTRRDYYALGVHDSPVSGRINLLLGRLISIPRRACWSVAHHFPVIRSAVGNSVFPLVLFRQSLVSSVGRLDANESTRCSRAQYDASTSYCKFGSAASAVSPTLRCRHGLANSGSSRVESRCLSAIEFHGRDMRRSVLLCGLSCHAGVYS